MSVFFNLILLVASTTDLRNPFAAAFNPLLSHAAIVSVILSLYESFGEFSSISVLFYPEECAL
jgi:hypothetical protein